MTPTIRTIMTPIIRSVIVRKNIMITTIINLTTSIIEVIRKTLMATIMSIMESIHVRRSTEITMTTTTMITMGITTTIMGITTIIMGITMTTMTTIMDTTMIITTITSIE